MVFPLLVLLEFRPGEPWKGYPNIDPETDPYVTPGSVTNNLSIHTVREADHLRDRSTGRCSTAGGEGQGACPTWPSGTESRTPSRLGRSLLLTERHLPCWLERAGVSPQGGGVLPPRSGA